MRLQKGNLFYSNGAFYVRYYKDGKRVAHRLVAKDCEKHYSTDCKAVKLLRDEFMLKVNTRQPESDVKDTLVADFWKDSLR